MRCAMPFYGSTTENNISGRSSVCVEYLARTQGAEGSNPSVQTIISLLRPQGGELATADPRGRQSEQLAQDSEANGLF